MVVVEITKVLFLKFFPEGWFCATLCVFATNFDEKRVTIFTLVWNLVATLSNWFQDTVEPVSLKQHCIVRPPAFKGQIYKVVLFDFYFSIS